MPQGDLSSNYRRRPSVYGCANVAAEDGKMQACRRLHCNFTPVCVKKDLLMLDGSGVENKRAESTPAEKAINS